MKHLFIVSAFFAILLNLIYYQSYSQSYNQFISLADSAYNADNYHLSGEYFEKAFSKSTGTGRDFYNASCSWSLAKDKDKSIQYLDSAFLYGFNRLGHIERDSDLDFIRKDSKYRNLIDREVQFYSDTLVNADDIIKALISNRKVIRFTDVEFTTAELPTSLEDWRIALNKYSVDISMDSLVDFSSKTLEIFNPKLTSGHFQLHHIKLNRLHITVGTSKMNLIPTFQLTRLVVNHLNIGGNREFNAQSEIPRSIIYLDSITTLKSIDIEEDPIRFHILDSKFEGESDLVIGKGEPSDFVIIRNSEFNNSSSFEANTYNFNTDDIILTGNKFNCYVNFVNCKANRVNIRDNIFLFPTDFSTSRFPEFNLFIPYSQFLSELGIYIEESPEFYTGEYSQIGNTNAYYQLVKNYQLLYNNYRQRGELESANRAYVKIKDLTLLRNKYLYEESGEFSNLIKYRLGQILKFYTDHGTSPSKAVEISSYIILAFSIFYFFFPSEWDTASKARLISNFKDFRQKNSKGYIKPFFIMLGGFSLSLLNAFTLSLNSFVTLGFGTIPTKGLARYVCILQGFIGWFLLSIFTVALINQVLT